MPTLFGKRVSKQERRMFLLTELTRQRRWVHDCGGTLQGYVNRYGSVDDPEHYGNGGEAIYKADADKLAELEAQYDAACEEDQR